MSGTATLSAPERLRARAERTVRPFAAEYPFEGRFLELPALPGQDASTWLHYLDEGPEGAAPLLLLHGNPTWSFLFRRLVRAFRGERRVVAPDHVGCGLSDKPARYPYTLAQHVLNLEQLVLALDLERITLVMHDWGGAIGMGFARRHPERVARLVAMNTAAFPARGIPLRIALCRTPLLGPLAVRGLGGFSRAALSMAVEKPLSPAARRGYLAPYADAASRVAVMAFVRDIPRRANHPTWRELAAIDAALPAFRDRPVCLVWGERDWCFTPRFRQAWQERFPAAEVHALPDAGHWLLEDEPERCVAALGGFLAQSPRA